MRVGLISDTHGLLRPEACSALRGADLILHAGDVGKADVLVGLASEAEVLAVRGNVDRSPDLAALPARRLVHLAGWTVLLVHDGTEVTPAAAAACDVVVCGHSHRPAVSPGRPLWVNPGSAGPRRFRLPVSVGWLMLSGPVPSASLRTLSVPPSRSRLRPGRP